MDKITVVAGIYLGLDRTINFIQDLRTRFPEVSLALGLLGNSKEYQDTLVEKFGKDSYIQFACGKYDQRVCFSENWDAACNLVKTERFVFLHNDMYIHADFFKNLNELMDKHENSFFLYTTVEPLENQGFVRPGKIVAPFGHDTDEFLEHSFNTFAKKYIETHNDLHYGYGFYLGGFIELLHKVGGFDYHSFVPIFCEDDDINLRIRLAGYKIIVADKALVYHFGSKTIRLDSETKVSMSSPEVESNRMFARKWGFEARYLWETGYENNDDISIGQESLAFTFSGNYVKGGYVPTDLDVLNNEPLVDKIYVSENSVNVDDKFVNSKLVVSSEMPQEDIVIVQCGPGDFHGFAYLVGALRFYHRSLKPGSRAYFGNYEVTINRTYPDASREDSKNYLLELQQNAQ